MGFAVGGTGVAAKIGKGRAGSLPGPVANRTLTLPGTAAPRPVTAGVLPIARELKAPAERAGTVGVAAADFAGAGPLDGAETFVANVGLGADLAGGWAALGAGFGEVVGLVGVAGFGGAVGLGVATGLGAAGFVAGLTDIGAVEGGTTGDGTAVVDVGTGVTVGAVGGVAAVVGGGVTTTGAGVTVVESEGVGGSALTPAITADSEGIAATATGASGGSAPGAGGSALL